MALFFTKNLYFRKKNSFMTPFLHSLYFHTHPITLLLEILRGRMHGPSPHLKFWGDRPPSLRPCHSSISPHMSSPSFYPLYYNSAPSHVLILFLLLFLL